MRYQRGWGSLVPDFVPSRRPDPGDTAKQHWPDPRQLAAPHHSRNLLGLAGLAGAVAGGVDDRQDRDGEHEQAGYRVDGGLRAREGPALGDDLREVEERAHGPAEQHDAAKREIGRASGRE